jgi:hypothetical protein
VPSKTPKKFAAFLTKTFKFVDKYQGKLNFSSTKPFFINGTSTVYRDPQVVHPEALHRVQK